MLIGYKNLVISSSLAPSWILLTLPQTLALKRRKTKQFRFWIEFTWIPASTASFVKIGLNMLLTWKTWGTLSQTLTLKFIGALYFFNYLQDHRFQLKAILLHADAKRNYTVCKSWPLLNGNQIGLITWLTSRITTHYTIILVLNHWTIHGTFLHVEVTCEEINTVPHVDRAPPSPIIWLALRNQVSHSVFITNCEVSSEPWCVRRLTSSSLCANIRSKIWCQNGFGFFCLF